MYNKKGGIMLRKSRTAYTEVTVIVSFQQDAIKLEERVLKETVRAENVRELTDVKNKLDEGYEIVGFKHYPKIARTDQSDVIEAKVIDKMPFIKNMESSVAV
mgnify:CR=1 FL=1